MSLLFDSTYLDSIDTFLEEDLWMCKVVCHHFELLAILEIENAAFLLAAEHATLLEVISTV